MVGGGGLPIPIAELSDTSSALNARLRGVDEDPNRRRKPAPLQELRDEGQDWGPEEEGRDEHGGRGEEGQCLGHRRRHPLPLGVSVCAGAGPLLGVRLGLEAGRAAAVAALGAPLGAWGGSGERGGGEEQGGACTPSRGWSAAAQRLVWCG
eukprot:CAMPEP_0206256102 /NCGR_PEP_ID=MMETSP0047_2-20121206/24588_1 /ASSEMBLY_ACC=CAM_ASM_000192 /TAXON_ID=195065 /ORGANISM="Chroomonas mesostigmatica_cf, Strain CCMP1168" /LENGTH=150 /DNA_ID=CAMNT_0053682519 /DNA_START=462 /DNA_END=910 /DNA_ORIENTATION=-